MKLGETRPSWSPALTTLAWATLIAGYAQFGAVSALNDVAHQFGRTSGSLSLQSLVGLSGAALGSGLAVLRGVSLVALPLGALGDRVGRMRAMRLLFSTGLATTGVAALAPNYWSFVVLFALARPLLAAVIVLVHVMAVESVGVEDRLRTLVVMAAANGVGAGLSAVLHGVIRGPDAFRWLFAISLVGLVLVPRLRRVHDTVHPLPDARRVHFGRVPRHVLGALVAISAVSLAVGAVTGPAEGFTFLYAEGLLGIAPRTMSLIVAVSALVGLAGLWSARALSSLTRRTSVGLGALGTSLAATFAFAGGRVAFVAGYFGTVYFAGLLAPTLAALSTEQFPRVVRATAAAWIGLAGVVGAVLGTLVFGYVIDVTGVHATSALRTAALVTFLPLVPLLALLARVRERSQHELD